MITPTLTNWPFKYHNGEQTPESIALQSMPAPPKQSLYDRVMSDPDVEDAPL